MSKKVSIRKSEHKVDEHADVVPKKGTEILTQVRIQILFGRYLHRYRKQKFI
jgi:hypothetical protein